MSSGRNIRWKWLAILIFAFLSYWIGWCWYSLLENKLSNPDPVPVVIKTKSDTAHVSHSVDTTLKADPAKWKSEAGKIKPVQYITVYRDSFIFIQVESSMDSTGTVLDSNRIHYEYKSTIIHDSVFVSVPEHNPDQAKRSQLYLYSAPSLSQHPGCYFGLQHIKGRALIGGGYDPFNKSGQITIGVKIF